MMENNKIIREYRKERRRVKSLVRRYEKRGYIFDKQIVPEIPKKVTQGSIRRLKGITTDKVFKSAFGWVEPRTGELLTALQGRAIERRETAKRQSEAQKILWWIRKHPNIDYEPQDEADVIIETTRGYIEQDIPLSWVEERKKIMLDLLESSIVQYGKREVALRIKADIDRLQKEIDRALLSSDFNKARAAIDSIAEILKGDKLTIPEQEELNRVFETDIDDEIYYMEDEML